MEALKKLVLRPEAIKAVSYTHLNTEKITGGLKHLVDEVNKIGLAFGIWFEPEMISPDSELYRKHPDLSLIHIFSGGQRQRIALARAMVKQPKVFLMDEPLSNLDAKLRNSMRSELIELHKSLGTTFVYVTHDQVEAMAMADMIVLINKGKIMQKGNPRELYNDPDNTFTAQFMGCLLYTSRCV